MKNRFSASLCLVMSLIAAAPAKAQNYLYATGSPTFSAQIPIENGFINVNNGDIHIEIPLAGHPQRGRLQLDERLVYDSRIWKIVGNGNYSWQPTNVPGSMGGWSFYSGIESGSVGYQSSGGAGYCRGGLNLLLSYTEFWNFNWTDPQGTQHSFPGAHTLEYGNLPPQCSGINGVTQIANGGGYALDGSGYYATITNYTNVVIRDKEGNQFQPSVIMSNPPPTTPEVTDANGNYWSQDSNGNLIDTLGRTPVQASTSGNKTFYDVLGVNGVRNRYTVTTETINYYTAFSQSGVRDVNGSFTAIQSITLPDGSAYSFTYDSGTGSGNYGELTSVTLPAGGVVQYTYTNFLDSFKNMNRWVHTRAKDGGTTTFSPSTISNCSGSAGCQEKTVVTDPSNNDTVYTFNLDNGTLLDASSWNTGVDAYQGLSTGGGTKMKSLNTTYAYASGTVYLTSQAAEGYQVPTKITANAVLQDVALTSQTVSTLDSTGTVPTLVQVWDYYSGSAPSAPTTQTIYEYNSGFFPFRVTQLNGSAIPFTQTTYTYDALPLAIVSPVHSGAPNTGTRNNPTAIARWVNTTNTTLNTNVTYDTAGTVLTATDPNGLTSYSHDGTDTFATAITPPTPSSGVSLPYSATYDPSTGLLLTETDPNAPQITSTSYDWNGRPTQINYADGGATTATYTQTRTSLYHYMTGGTYTTTYTEYDGYGRASRLAIANGQSASPYYQTDYCYDINGRLSFQTYQYQGIGWAVGKVCSGAGDSYAYDALSRVTKVTHGSGFAATTQYKGRAAITKDEAGAQRITQTDALGRITVACEISSNNSMPDSSGSPTTCATDYPGAGFNTYYTYSLQSQNQTTSVAQGAQTRTFETDSLGRTVLQQEPESGQTTYSYSYNGTGLAAVRTRPRANQGSASTVTTTATQYDSLGRVVSVNYNDGTPNKTFSYDVTCCLGQGVVSANLKGRLAAMVSGAGTNQTGGLFSYDVMGRIVALWQCAPSTCGSSSAQVSRPLYFSYDLLGDVATEEDLVSGVIQYGYSPALEVTSITNLSYTGAQNVPNLVSNVQNGPNGPFSWSLGNGLTGVAMYDVPNQAVRDGGWVCKGTTQTYCTGGTQLYGWVADTGSPALPQSYDTINGHYLYGYDEFNRLTSTNINSGQAAYSFTYDRWGNRTAQTLTAGSSGWQWSASFNNLTNQVNGFSYDAAGNLLNDGSRSYKYDAEGNVLVDAGATGTYYYVYDALNRRVSAAAPSGTNEFVYDPANLRMSTWNAAGNVGTEGRIYWGGEQIAYRSGDGTAYLDHHDWLGSERLRTNYQGVAAAYIPTLAFGDGTTQTVGGVGVTQDSSGFASLEFDAQSNTDHAQYRQYSAAEGRWMSPDPYSGSYELTNPQSLNRYSYVQNNPAWFNDPSGQFAEGPALYIGTSICGPACGIGAAIGVGIGELLVGLFGFDAPSFHGTLSPRPADNSGWDGNFGESLGIPTSVPQGNWGIGLALGVPSDTCEFGACGGSNGLIGNIGAAYSQIAIPPQVQNWMFMWNWAMQQKSPVNGPWHYGNWCGHGGAGVPIDSVDAACMAHDYCYSKNGLTYADNFNPLIGEPKGMAMQNCNEALCSSTSNASGTAGQIDLFFSWGGGGLFDCHQ